MKLQTSGLEALAIGVAAALICLPLLAGSVDSATLIDATKMVKNANGSSIDGQGNSNNYLVILGIVIASGNLCVITFQSWIFGRQTELMEGQLKATETAANAALAGLDRPWLVIEGFKLNEKDWLDCKNPLIAEFEIANHGKAPALIKRIVVCHFRGPHHHNGYPSSKLPDGVLRFPEKDDFVGFLNRHGRAVMQEVKASSEPTTINPDNPQERGFANLTLDHSFVISGGDRSETFCAWGQASLTVFVTGIPIVQTTESYLIGSIYYEFPGNQAELLRFCYKANGRGGFDLYRDYAPYNETQNAKAK